MKRAKAALHEMMGSVRTADMPEATMIEVKFDPSTITQAKRIIKRDVDELEKPKTPFQVWEAMEGIVWQLARVADAAGDKDIGNAFRSLSSDVSRTAKAFKEAVDPEAPDE